MTVRYSVSFEFDVRPPLTHRGTVTATQIDTCMRLATRNARLALKPQGWSSVVCVVLERMPERQDAVAATANATTVDIDDAAAVALNTRGTSELADDRSCPPIEDRADLSLARRDARTTPSTPGATSFRGQARSPGKQASVSPRSGMVYRRS